MVKFLCLLKKYQEKNNFKIKYIFLGTVEVQEIIEDENGKREKVYSLTNGN